MKPLIVVIPGIGGSILADDDGRTVYTVKASTALARCLDPQALDMDRSLHPVGLIPTFGACHPLLITGYDRLMSRARPESGGGGYGSSGRSSAGATRRLPRGLPL